MRRLFAVAAASALAVGGALALTTPTASGNVVETGGLPAGGTVTIQTGLPGGSGSVTTVLTSGSTLEQTVSNNTCDSLTAGPIAISPGGSGTTACYGNLGFGVDPGREGLPLWQNFLNPNTESGEVLSIALTPEAGEVVFLGDVSLDIEAVRPVPGDDLQVTTYLKGEEVDSFGVPLGSPVLSWPPNYRVGFALENAADRVDITAIGSTRFQLEGDTNNRQGSTFTLAQATDVVPCGTTELASEGGDATLTVTTGESCQGGEAVVFTRDGNEIAVLKEPSDATFLLEITDWLPEAAAYPVPATLIDYSPLDGVDNAEPMVVCGGTTADPSLPADFVDVIPGGLVDGWCVAGQSFTLVDDGVMQVAETLYGQGDPRFNRI
jgi:hypothetical protein